MLPTYITATRSLTCFTTRQVVGDEQIGQAEPVLQVEQQVEDLRLHRDVERRDRLVGDDQRSGSSASARAMPMRWRWPPEKACGKRCM